MLRGSHFATDSRRRRLNNIWPSLGSGAGSLWARCHCQQWKNPVIVWPTRRWWVSHRLWVLTTLTPEPCALPCVTSYPRSRPGEPGSGSAAASDRCCLLPLKKMTWGVPLLWCPVLGGRNVAWSWCVIRPARACTIFYPRWDREVWLIAQVGQAPHVCFRQPALIAAVLQYVDLSNRNY